MNCVNSCYEAIIESCNDIVVRAGLNPATPFYWIIKKSSSSNIIQRLATTDADGQLTIPKADLPAGYLVQGNHYTIELRNGGNYLQKETLFIGAVPYDCIIAELVKINREQTDDSKVNVIGNLL